MFADFEVLGGDFLPSKESYIFHGMFPRFKSALKGNQFLLSEQVGADQQKLSIPFTDAIRFEQIDADKLNSGDATVLGILGGIALGPMGLLAGGALGAMNKKKLFVIEFKDGRKMLGKQESLPSPI